MSVQLKGVRKIEWKRLDKDSHKARSPSIKSKTANYWLGVPIPVFLFVADLSAENIYFVPTEEHIRSKIDSLEEQDSITFHLHDGLNLKSKLALALLEWFYNRERAHDQCVFHLMNLINQIEVFGEFIISNQNRDSFLEVETERHLQFRALHEACRMASFYFNEESGLDSIRELYAKDFLKWNEEYCYLHEETLDKALQNIERIFPVLVRKTVELVAEKQASYWRKRDYFFFNLCRNGDIIRALKQFEEDVDR